MSDDLFLFIRNSFTASAQTAISTVGDRNDNTLNRTQLTEMMTSDENVDYLTNQVVARADPTRSEVPQSTVEAVSVKVKNLLLSWKNLGKYDKAFLTVNNKQREVGTATMREMINFYNNEFITTFAETLVPTSDITKVKSVVNPDGMFAQQQRVEITRSRPVHFHERSIFRRLNAWDHERPIDETQSLFYGFDKKPDATGHLGTSRVSDSINQRDEIDSYLSRQGLSYRLKPNY